MNLRFRHDSRVSSGSVITIDTNARIRRYCPPTNATERRVKRVVSLTLLLPFVGTWGLTTQSGFSFGIVSRMQSTECQRLGCDPPRNSARPRVRLGKHHSPPPFFFPLCLMGFKCFSLSLQKSKSARTRLMNSNCPVVPNSRKVEMHGFTP